MNDEKVTIRDTFYKDGSVRRQIANDGKWVDLYTQENAVSVIDWDARNIEIIKENFWMPYKEAQHRFGHLPNFPS